MPDSIVRTVPLILPNGVEIRVEANAPDDREADVAFSDVAEVFSMENIKGAIEGIAQLVKDSMEKIAPSKASVEFAIEVGLESGKLTALWVKGTGKANLKIAMEWSRG
jgi:Trypsin-co-occurring domain 1